MAETVLENKEIRQAALFEHVDSVECFESREEVRPVLRDISFEVLTGESWCVCGPSHFELRLLLELLANARPYARGRCVLCERGMMRKKRILLPHVHYIGGTSMLFHNMNVLEYMMFITSHSKEEAIPRQRRLLNALVEVGLGFLSLSPIARLNAPERAVVTLFTATLTDSRLVVWNISRLGYTPALREAVTGIAQKLREQGKALVFSTGDYELAQAAADHVLLLKGGGVLHAGSAREFCGYWDKLLFTLADDDVAPYETVFKKLAPDCEYKAEQGKLLVYDLNGVYADMGVFYSGIGEAGLCPASILRNTPNIGNAVEKALCADPAPEAPVLEGGAA